MLVVMLAGSVVYAQEARAAANFSMNFSLGVNGQQIYSQIVVRQLESENISVGISTATGSYSSVRLYGHLCDRSSGEPIATVTSGKYATKGTVLLPYYSSYVGRDGGCYCISGTSGSTSNAYISGDFLP